jgi:hypothetical protein
VCVLAWAWLLGGCARERPTEAQQRVRHAVATATAWSALEAGVDQALTAARAHRPDPTLGMRAPMARPEEFRRGVALGLFSADPSLEARKSHYTTMLDEIVAAGATDLSLVPRWSQRDVEASTIAPLDGTTVPDAELEWVIEQARARGLRLFLMPYIYVQVRARGKWRGTIDPGDPDAWWASYGRFILHYARMAQRHDAALFSVGSELLSMETQDARWRALIAQVREVYSGQLTYSSNWDHFEVPTFWDAVDVVGMTAYQELSKRPDPSWWELTKGWDTFRKRLRVFLLQQQRRFVFTEIGYPSHSGAAARPWDYSGEGASDVALQARCFRAMVDVWHDDPRLAGVYVWNWFGFADGSDRGYSPRGKPSREVIAHWYTASKGDGER